MRKVRMVQWTRPNGMWFVETPQGNLIVRGWDEAMFLAQLLADPALYISQAEQRAWAEGHKAGVLQEYFRVPGVPNSYREEDQ